MEFQVKGKASSKVSSIIRRSMLEVKLESKKRGGRVGYQEVELSHVGLFWSLFLL